MSRPKLRTLRPNVRLLDTRVGVLKSGSWRAGKTTDQRGYDYTWKKFRELWLAKHPLCGDREDGRSAEHSRCAREGRVTAATDVDHITPHRGDMVAFWQGPWQSLCGTCHREKTQQEAPNV
jgi:5-methylcytosine-specific restriction protein A